MTDQYERIKDQITDFMMEDTGHCAIAARILMQHEVREAPQITDTMATNGETLAYSSDFIASLSRPELRSLLLHEALHPALLHPWRCEGRNLALHNIACDHVINLMLIAQGEQLPPDGFADPKYAGWTSEEVYEDLIQGQQSKPKPKPGPGQDGEGQDGQGQDGQGQDGQGQDGQGQDDTYKGQAPGGFMPSPVDAETGDNGMVEAQLMVRQAVTQAQVGKHAGDKFLADIVQAIAPPQEDWKTLLDEFARTSMSSRKSWRNPNSRYVWQDIYIPGKSKGRIKHLVSCVDTSGSISRRALDAFMSELEGMFDEGIIDKLTILWTDTRVRGEQEFTRGDTLDPKPVGGGGTDFRAAMERVAELGPNGVVWLSDMECFRYGEEPECPVLWVQYGSSHYSQTPEYGKVIQMLQG